MLFAIPIGDVPVEYRIDMAGSSGWDAEMA